MSRICKCICRCFVAGIWHSLDWVCMCETAVAACMQITQHQLILCSGVSHHSHCVFDFSLSRVQRNPGFHSLTTVISLVSKRFIQAHRSEQVLYWSLCTGCCVCRSPTCLASGGYPHFSLKLKCVSVCSTKWPLHWALQIKLDFRQSSQPLKVGPRLQTSTFFKFFIQASEILKNPNTACETFSLLRFCCSCKKL